jgi:hypothetical protein
VGPAPASPDPPQEERGRTAALIVTPGRTTRDRPVPGPSGHWLPYGRRLEPADDLELSGIRGRVWVRQTIDEQVRKGLPFFEPAEVEAQRAPISPWPFGVGT